MGAQDGLSGSSCELTRESDVSIRVASAAPPRAPGSYRRIADPPSRSVQHRTRVSDREGVGSEARVNWLTVRELEGWIPGRLQASGSDHSPSPYRIDPQTDPHTSVPILKHLEDRFDSRSPSHITQDFSLLNSDKHLYMG